MDAIARSAPLPVHSSSVRLRIDQNNANELFGLDQQRDIKAIELDLTQAQMRQSPQAWGALSRWVARGGVVLLHTDAAQLFGFRTVTARERTRERAGQLFGRSRASLPFCANPLLWGGVSQTLEGRGHGALGVYLVYYELQSGDQLAVSHGAGIPLLSVTDLSAASSKTPAEPPLYAAMLAPYGSGWAIVLPRFIEARADGAPFSRNLDNFIGDLPASSPSDDSWTSVSASAIETAQRRAVNGGAVASDDLARAFSESLQPLPQKQWPSDKLPAIGAYQRPIATTPPADDADVTNQDSETVKAQLNAPTPERLLLRRSEAASLAQIFARGEAQSGARELLEQLAARLAMQRGQAPGSQVPGVAASEQWFSNLVALSSRERRRKAPTDESQNGEKPDAAVLQIQLWNGLFAATAANAFGADAQGRAAAWREALHWWNLALGEPLEPLDGQMTFVPDPANANEPPAPNFAPIPDKSDIWLGSVPTATIKQWQQIARWEFAKALHEAPMTLTWQGPNGEQNAVDMFPVDAAVEGVKTPIAGNEYPFANSFRWRLVQSTFQMLDSEVRTDLGWGADQAEVRLTPSPWSYSDYGAGAMDFTMLPKDDDVRLKNGCIFLWSSPTPLSDTLTGIQVPKQRFTYVERNPADPYDVAYSRIPLEKEIQNALDQTAQSDARSKLKTDSRVIDKEVQGVRTVYALFLAGGFGWQENEGIITPYSLVRLHRQLAMQTLTQGGVAPPPWLQVGLQNIGCLSLSTHARLQGIYPALPAELQHKHPRDISHFEWNKNVVAALTTYEPRLTGKEGKGGLAKVSLAVDFGPSLMKFDETRQVQFFYEQFGRGAVVETLQRLGAGQNIDAALTATTGLNQSQFFDQWRRWDAAPPIAPPEVSAPDAPAEVVIPDVATPPQN